jgi:hypothetical protein
MKKFYLISTFALIVHISFGQAPGGVSSNLTLWINGSAGTSTTTTGSALSSWTYINDATKQFNASGAAQPTFNNGVINFWPAVNFNGAQIMDGPTAANAPIPAGSPAYSMFAVWRSNNLNNYQRVWTQVGTSGSGNGFALATWNDARHICGNELETSPYDYLLTAHFNTNVWNITQMNILNQPTSDQQIITDSNFSTSPIISNTDVSGANNGPANRSLGADLNELGSKAGNANQSLYGDIAEVIVFSRPINAGGEREKVFSYLSFKYGIPLNANLVSSTGLTPWSNTTNAGYTNGVFGLAKDNGSNLLVNSSNSLTSGNGDGTGIAGQGNIILSNPTALTTDQTFLMIGNDGAGFAQSASTLANAQRFAQRWKVQETGSVGNVDLSFDLNGIPNTGTFGNPANYKLQIDQDGDGDFTTGPQSYLTPTGFSGSSIINFAGITLNNGVVFTVLSSSTTLPVTWVDFTATLVNNNINLNWTIDNNQNGKVYEVEHSLDGSTFTPIGEVANNPTVKSYNYVYTPTVGGTHYFRIHEVDLDGEAIYSKVVSVNTLASNASIRVIKNPVSDNFTILEVNTNSATSVSVELWTLGGTRISTQLQSVGAGLSRFNVPLNNVAAGNYILKIRSGSLTQTEQVIKL